MLARFSCGVEGEGEVIATFDGAAGSRNIRVSLFGRGSAPRRFSISEALTTSVGIEIDARRHSRCPALADKGDRPAMTLTYSESMIGRVDPPCDSQRNST